MAVSMEFLLCLCICAVLSSLRYVSSTSSMPACPLQSPSLLDTLQSKCPLSFSPNSPLEVNGYFLDRTLTSQRGSGYIAMLFYASWCPFSHDARLIFEALSSMFPQIEHLAVEQSSVMPSVFSRYGIHSFPTILMVSQTSRIHFRGSKDLHSLVEFYKKVTGAGLCIPEIHTSFQSFLGVLCAASEVGNIQRDEPYIGSCPSHNQCEVNLGEAETL